ncbi:hypothetical protein N9811_01130 [Bacteroidia bacterium]|nr:hypothetical protein [Bacteroidia bacterium]
MSAQEAQAEAQNRAPDLINSLNTNSYLKMRQIKALISDLLLS